MIRDHNLAQLMVKCHYTGSIIQEFVNKRRHIEYDHESAVSIVMSDYVGDVPCFVDKKFERT